MPSSPDSEVSPIADSLARYSRQVLYDGVGEAGQRRLQASRVVIIGCGALGTVLANTLVRAGVGHVRLCDRDFIELNNLQRQVLFDEGDIAEGWPKAEAAARKLRRINSTVTVEAHVVDVNHHNVARLAEGVDLILDGTDNFEARFLINDLAVKTETPWIYGAVIGATGLCMSIVPHDTPCLRCVFEDAPPPEMNPTCDTAGVLSSAVNIVAGFQAIEAMKILTGQLDQLHRRLMNIDAWTGRVVNLNVQASFEKNDCPCCKRRDFAYLDGRMASTTTTLCGRGAVQVSAPEGVRVDFPAIARKLGSTAEAGVRYNKFMLTARVNGFDLVLFPDGRAIIKGTEDAGVARTLYARFVGV